MNSLNSFRSILHTLKSREIKSLLRYLDYYKESRGGEQAKSVQLVKSILSDNNISSADLQKKLYGKLNYHAFNKLVLRARDKSMEVLLFDSNMDRNLYSIRNKIIFDLRKKLIQTDMLFLRGVKKGIEQQYAFIIDQSKKFEAYDILILALYAKQRLIRFELNSKRSTELKRLIQSSEQTWILFNQAQVIFNEMFATMGSSINYNSYKNELSESLTTLSSHYEITGSATIGYYYFLLLTDQYQNEKKFIDAEKSLQQLLNILKTNKAVYTQSRYGTALINIANNKIFLFDFESALQNVHESKKFFLGQPMNTSIVEELEFYCYYYLGNLHRAHVLADKLLSYPGTVNYGLQRSRRTYLLGCVRFALGEYALALENFHEYREIEKDKEGWNIIKRITVILCRIELDELESTDLNLQSLDKFLKRLLKTKSIYPRYLLIGRILKKLVASNFNYKQVYISRKKYFNLLESVDSDYACKLKGPELIIFEEWYKFKMLGRPYNHQEAMFNFLNSRRN